MSKLAYFVIALLTVLLNISPVSAADIEFEITGIKAGDGMIYIQLFDSETAYQQGQALASQIVKPTAENEVVTFSGIAAGHYGVRLYHDENNSGQLETNLFGLPTEGYAFSNNAKPNYGPVNFAQIQFAVSEQDTVVTNTTQVIY